MQPEQNQRSGSQYHPRNTLIGDWDNIILIRPNLELFTMIQLPARENKASLI